MNKKGKKQRNKNKEPKKERKKDTDQIETKQITSITEIK